MKKRHAALFAATVLAISCTGALAETTTNNVMNDEKYTSVVAQTLPDAEDMVIDYDNYYGQVIEGYYNYDCYVNENVTRSAKFYVPAKTVYNQPTVFIMVPSGVNTWGFFVESGWKDAADKYVFHVVLAETDESGEWGDIDNHFIVNMEHYGKSFQQKKAEARMSVAAILLSDQSLSITDIAENLGYSSIEHFSSSFRRFYNTSPREFRKHLS